MKVYDNYEISPCKRYEETDSPGKFYFEVCEAEEADVWTLYGHINGEGVEAIGDFGSREHAEEVYSRITGQAFPASYQSGDRLSVMHAGPKLLEKLQAVAELRRKWRSQDEQETIDSIEYMDGLDALDLDAVIAEATGRQA